MSSEKYLLWYLDMFCIYLSGAGLLVFESLTFVTSSSEFLRFLQTIGIARAHEPSQIKLKFSRFRFIFQSNFNLNLAKVRSSSPIFSF